MKFFKIILITFFLFNQAYGQGSAKSWLIGIGLNAVDDDGKPFKELVNLSNGWNALPFPSTFSFEYYFNSSFSLELNESITTYALGNTIDKVKISRSMFFMSLDFNAKYHFNTLYKKAMWFDPYITPGFGITVRGKNTVPTGNIGFGSNFWVKERIGIYIQSMAKFSFSDLGTNYLQHSLGVKIKY